MAVSTDEPPPPARGYSIALASSVLLSTTAIFIRYLTETYHIPALVLAFWRDVFVALTLLIVLLLLRRDLLRTDRRNLAYLTVYGAILAVFNGLWTLSVAFNGASVATVLAYSSAAFTALLGWWVLKERLDWTKGMAVVLSLAGCALVAGAFNQSAWETNFLGILAGLATGLGYAVYTLMGRAASQRGLNPWTTLIYTFSAASAFLLLLSLIPGGLLPGSASSPGDLFWLGNSLAGWGILVFLAGVPTLAGFGLYNVSLVYLPSSVANLVLTSEPLFTVLIAYLLLNERLTGLQIAGGLLIGTGILLLRLQDRRLTSNPAADPTPASLD